MEENQHNNARENIMGTMDINPLLIRLSVPMMVSMLVQALYNVVDSVFVSHVSESALILSYLQCVVSRESLSLL